MSPIVVSNVIILSPLLVPYTLKCGKPIFEGHGHINESLDRLDCVPLDGTHRFGNGEK
jgi:hypothetical protein